MASGHGRQVLSGSATVVGGWVFLFLVAILAYFPGLSGPFILDDVLNIATLGDYGGVSNWETFKAFVFGGHSGPTGRPVSLLTFLIDATNWPADPHSFKRTNLVIHLLNGGLLGLLVYQILCLLQYKGSRARWLALICAGGWLLHPFLVSTTLYVVQRMAQLSTLFVFAGLNAYLYGRIQLVNDRMKAGVMMIVSIGLFTILATLSKENGIVLPLLAGILEYTVVASQRPRVGKLDRYWAVLLFVVPAAAVLGYLCFSIALGGFFGPLPNRDFSAYERLLTQFRVLVDYQRYWFIPSPYTPGVFQDHFVKSSGWLSPATTVFSALYHAVLIAVAIRWRRAMPLFALAVLFFYTSHILESTVLNLELYFEHRNYLAAAFLFLPAVALLSDKLDRRWFSIACTVALIILAGFTRHSATVWSDYSRMVEESARIAPTSVRAQARYATILYETQQYEESLRILDTAIADIPGDHADLLVNRLVILCNLGILNEELFDDSATRISRLYFNPGKFFLFRSFVTSVAQGRCPGLAIESLQPVLTEMLGVPANGQSNKLPYSQLNYLIGFVQTYSGLPVAAEESFGRSLDADPSAVSAMRMARVMAEQHFIEQAQSLANRALTILIQKKRHNPGDPGISESEIRAFISENSVVTQPLRENGTSGPDQEL